MNLEYYHSKEVIMSKSDLIKKYDDVLNKPFNEFDDKDWKQFEKFLKELDNEESNEESN